MVAIRVGLFLSLVMLAVGHAAAQQAVVSTPLNRVNDSFFERIGVGFNFSIPNGGNPPIVFRQGGAAAAIPAFGGFDPNAGANLGVGIRGNGFNANFNISAAQGSSRSFSSVTPSVTVPNGGTGFISDGSQRPFVTGLIPVVGGYNVPRPYFPSVQPHTINPLRAKIQQYYEQQAKRTVGDAERLAGAMLPRAELSPTDKMSLKLGASRASSAGYGDLSVAEIKRNKAVLDAAETDAKNQEILALIERARGAEAAGKLGAAKIYYRQAATRATGDLSRELVEKLRTLSEK